jgi:hypothetical protein
VNVSLTANSSTNSGFQWSTKAGPPFQLQSQTLVTASVSIPGERPIHWVLPS